MIGGYQELYVSFPARNILKMRNSFSYARRKSPDKKNVTAVPVWTHVTSKNCGQSGGVHDYLVVPRQQADCWARENPRTIYEERSLEASLMNLAHRRTNNLLFF